MSRPVAARSDAFTTGLTPWVIVGLAAILPYLPTINDYFVRDDFGVVQLLAGKPFTYFPRWFASSWMDDIWGYLPDEVRPFPALSYQLTALGGPVSPFLHHALNILIHAANGLLVMAIALRAAGLGVPAAMTAALIFVLLPVHAESVAWITGRVDSMPAFFYLASFLAYVRYRQESKRALYGWAVVLFFVALFTKQNTITMVATLVGYDVIVGRRRILPIFAFVRPYIPFAAMTAAYLWLRYLLFGQVAREGALNARALEEFGVLLGRHTRHVIAGDMDAPAIVVWLALAAVVAVWLCDAWRHSTGYGIRIRRSGTTAAVLRTGLVGDWRAADRGGRLPFAAARVSRRGGMGHRPRRDARGRVVDPAWCDVAARGRGERRARAAGLYSCRSIGRSTTGARWPTSRTRSCATSGTLRCRRRGQPDRRRCAGPKLGVGAAVRRAAAIPAHGSSRPRLHHLAARAQLLHRSLVRRDPPGDSRLVGRRRPRFRGCPALGSTDRSPVPSDERRFTPTAAR